MNPPELARLHQRCDGCAERLYALGLLYQKELKDQIFLLSGGLVGITIYQALCSKKKSKAADRLQQKKLSVRTIHCHQLRLVLSQYKVVNQLLKLS
jgi:hypothetical protein